MALKKAYLLDSFCWRNLKSLIVADVDEAELFTLFGSADCIIVSVLSGVTPFCDGHEHLLECNHLFKAVTKGTKTVS